MAHKDTKVKVSVSLDRELVANMNQFYKNDGPCPSRLLNKLGNKFFARIERRKRKGGIAG